MRGMIDAVEAVLDQGIRLLESLHQTEFTQVLPLANGATIGGHYRHGLEHFRQLLSGLEAGTIDYDARNRDLLVESDRLEAIRATKNLKSSLKRLSKHSSEDPLEVKCGITYGDDDAGDASSTLGRELIFCISHAIHHYAMIALILRSEQKTLPEGFGVAPSTVRHRLQSAGKR